MLIPLLLAAHLAAPIGSVCDPPTVKSSCLAWCVGHPPTPTPAPTDAWKTVPPNCAVEYDAHGHLVASYCRP